MGLCRWGGVVDVREAAANDDPTQPNQPTNQPNPIQPNPTNPTQSNPTQPNLTLQPKSIEAHRATQAGNEQAGNEQAVIVRLNVASRSRHQSPQQVLLLLS